MKKSMFRIGVVLLLILALPLSYLIIKQASELTENEALVQRVFDKQLETILFTINQNAENLIVAWINQVDLPLNARDEIMSTICEELVAKHHALKSIQYFNIVNKTPLLALGGAGSELPKLNWPDSLPVDRMVAYLDNQYQRIESIREGEYVHLYFVLKSAKTPVLCAFTIHAKTFIEQNLRPGIQQISQDRFHVVIRDSIHTEGNLLSDSLSVEKTQIHEQSLWYFPGYTVMIGLQTATIDELVKARSQTDRRIFVIIFLVVIVGITFVLASIRKEMRLAEMKSEFVSNVSHEIRTPLALISMYTETLLMNRVKTPEKRQEYLNIIHHETTRLSGMVNRILSFSKMEKGKRNYHLEEIELNALIEEVIHHYSPHFKAHMVHCTMELDEAACQLKADREAVTEVLINLIENAVKYGREGEKKLMIRSKCTHNQILVEVEDDGIGIASKHLKHIFDKFYRVTQGNLAHKAKGSGIGLNIVKEIMEHHQGKVLVESKPGVGSKFILMFNQ
ncbi:MAG: HAMP domain-containing histidine kinase [Prolixibacteraceae bacterium]|nr:HAMP domain-containing histidine kinase [Prolixibacteraceae bacterium]